MSRHDRAVTLCGHPVTAQHVCMFTESREEQYRILNPFFQEGLDAGEDVFTIVDAARQADHAERMRAGGVAVDASLASGQLRLLASEDTYGQDGTFEVERMYALLEDQLRAAAQGPRGRVRICGDADWVLRHMQTSDELMTYEAKVNLLAPKFDCTLVCVYDVNQCSGQVVADALSTHSHVVLGGRLRENPYYVEPLAFLRAVALRRAHPAPIRVPQDA